MATASPPMGRRRRRPDTNNKPSERDPDRHLVRARRHEVRSAESGKDVVESLLVREVLDRKAQSDARPLFFVEEVVGSHRYIEQIAAFTRSGLWSSFERIYAPLTASLLHSFPGDSKLHTQKRSQLDRLYQRVADDLDQLLRAVGLKIAA